MLALVFRPDYPRAWTSAVPQGATTETRKRVYMGFIDGDHFQLFGFELADGRVVIQLRSTTPDHDPRRWQELEAWFEKRLK